jgi:predicted RNase H-like HicB family nuclease
MFDPANQLPVILWTDEDGHIVAECPLIPGCVSQGRDRKEALANIREAIEVSLENREAEGWTLPEWEFASVTTPEAA